MKSPTKLVCVLSYNFLLWAGLFVLAAPAAGETKVDQSAADQEKPEGMADQSVADRIGGQAGLKSDQEKLKGMADQSDADRIGGQAGLKSDQEKLEGMVDQSAADRIGGQAGLKSDQEKLEGSSRQ